MFLNLRGREQHGHRRRRAPRRAALKAEIIGQAARPARRREAATIGVREAFDTAAIYTGPYLENAPDLIIGYNAGYRTSWDCATGVVSGPVFEDNTKAWSGDHCIDPRLVPGVFFCNRKVERRAATCRSSTSRPRRCGCSASTPPAHMDGRPWAVAS